MAALTFTKSGSLYVATQTVSGDFALHLESASESTYSLNMKSDSDAPSYAPVDVFTNAKVVDYQYQGAVYPAYLQITSSQPVTYGSIIEA